MRNTPQERDPEPEAAEPAGGVTAVTPALSLMEAFQVGESSLSLSYALDGSRSAETPKVGSTWHPA